MAGTDGSRRRPVPVIARSVHRARSGRPSANRISDLWRGSAVSCVASWRFCSVSAPRHRRDRLGAEQRAPPAAAHHRRPARRGDGPPARDAHGRRDRGPTGQAPGGAADGAGGAGHGVTPAADEVAVRPGRSGRPGRCCGGRSARARALAPAGAALVRAGTPLVRVAPVRATLIGAAVPVGAAAPVGTAVRRPGGLARLGVVPGIRILGGRVGGIRRGGRVRIRRGVRGRVGRRSRVR